VRGDMVGKMKTMIDETNDEIAKTSANTENGEE